MNIIEHIIENCEAYVSKDIYDTRQPQLDDQFGEISIHGLHNLNDVITPGVLTRVSVRIDDELKTFIEDAGVIYPLVEGKNVGDDYYLDILKNANGDFMLHLKYQSILGGRPVGAISEELVESLKQKILATKETPKMKR